MSDQQVDQGRRTWVVMACGAGAVGGVAAAVPFVASFEPSERARAAGAPVEADVNGLKPGQKMTVEWRGQPVWIVRRTPAEVAELSKIDGELADPKSLRKPDEQTPVYARNEWRSRDKEFLVVVGICTHLGCSPSDRFQPGAQASLPADWPGGFLCPCHGSTFDMAGRVFKNKPAPDNLRVPPYTLAGGKLVIGVDETTKA